MPLVIVAVSFARQWAQHVAVCRLTISGLSVCRSVSPLCPTCPPLFLSDGPRKLPAIRGFLPNPSLDGGLLLLLLSLPNCRRRSATSCFRTAFSCRQPETSCLRPAISRLSPSINACSSGESFIPPLTHIHDCAAIKINVWQKNNSALLLLYPVHVTTRKSLGLMMRKLSVTESQVATQLRGTVSHRKPSVASANWAQVA